MTSVADPDPGSGAFLTSGSGMRDPGSGIGFFRIPYPGSRIPDPKPIFLTIFWVKSSIILNSLKIDPSFFLQTYKNKIIYNFVKFVAIRKGMTKHFFHPLLC